MRSTSAASLAAVAAGFEPVLRAAGPEAATLGAQMFAVVDALDSSGSLRRAVTDPSRSADAKAALVAQMLSGKADDRVVEVVSAFARVRWSAEADLTEALEQVAADAVLAAAQSAGTLERVEHELFRLDRMLVGQRELRRALTDRGVSPQLRGTLVRDLLKGKVDPATEQLVERAAIAPRGRTMTTMLSALGRLAARRREMLVAVVTAAAPLSAAQSARLTEVLERTYGRAVQLNVSVDPDVLGGLRVEVGPEVVDSTMVARLDEVRRRLAG